MERWRFEVKVRDRKILAEYMRFREMSYAELARRVGCSKATIGHLVTGVTTSTKPERARAIEKALGVPDGLLFVAKVSCVAGDTAA